MQEQKITIEVIETKEFHVAARGYNQREVDEFLDSICDELESMEAEMATLQATINRLQNQAVPQPIMHQAYQAPKPAPIAPASMETDGTFREILEMAQRVKEQTIADAEAKAAEIIGNAEIEVKARLGNLAEEKDELEAQVASLKTAVRDYKARFAQMLNAAQEVLDATEEL